MKKILIVDDNRDLAANIAEILDDAGHRAFVAADGREALAVVKREALDAVLTDMRMPHMSGPELLREIRKVKPDLPVMAFTAYSGSAELAQAEALGLLAVLPKPVPVQRLVNLIDAARPCGLVLVVEDDDAFREDVTELLRDRGMSVVAASTLAAIEQLGPVQPFAALVDLNLADAPPGESLLRVQARFPGVPLVPMSSQTDLVLAGPDTMAKPIDAARLLARLDALYRDRTSA